MSHYLKVAAIVAVTMAVIVRVQPLRQLVLNQA